VCVKDCGLHKQNIDVVIVFVCLVGWLDSSPKEILKILSMIFKKLLGLILAAVNTGMALVQVPANVHVHVRLRGPQSLAHCVVWLLNVQNSVSCSALY